MGEREQIKFFLPGPSYVLEDVRRQLCAPVVPHRSPEFRRLYSSVTERLQPVFRTRRDVAVATSSATLLMQAALASTVEDEVLCTTCGAFSERWIAISRSLGQKPDVTAVPWGHAMEPELIVRALERKKYSAVTLTHCETSTGVLSPLRELAEAIREHSDALILVDAVSSLGGAPLEAEDWRLDVVVTASQKALAIPPGLALFTMSERAEKQAANIASRGFYTDLLRYLEKHRAGGTITTPAESLFFALDGQLDRILGEGMEQRWERHRNLQHRTFEWAGERGFNVASAPGHGSPTVSCLRPPATVDAPDLVARLSQRGFTVGGGYGGWKPDTFRIGHMGEVTRSDLDTLLKAIDELT